MIGIMGDPIKNRFIFDYEDEDVCFLDNLIRIIGERNTLLKEAKKENKEC